jgi:mevalonate pyrophosphate decarboxylase
MGLVTQQNVTTVTNSLVDMVKNSETVHNATTSVQNTANTAAGYANTASQYASALSTLLGAFGGK